MLEQIIVRDCYWKYLPVFRLSSPSSSALVGFRKELTIKMTTSIDSEMSWISLEDAQRPKKCFHCHQLLSVKQINLSEACRTCFNEECSSSADIEYVRRSYRLMELEASKIQDLNEPPETLDEEMQRANQLLNEVEILVAYRLNEDLKNELKSCNKKQLEASKSAELSTKGHCDEPEKLCENIPPNVLHSQLFRTNTQPEPSTTMSCVSGEFGGPVPQYGGNAVPWFPQDTLVSQSETCYIIDNLISSHDGKVSPLSPSAYDNSPNDMWECSNNFWQTNGGSECLDMKPNHEDMNHGEVVTNQPDSALDNKESVPLSNVEVVTNQPDPALDSKESVPLSNDEVVLNQPDPALDSKESVLLSYDEVVMNQADCTLDSKERVPLSNEELISPGDCLISESKMEEWGGEESCKTISTDHPKSSNPSCSVSPLATEDRKDFGDDCEKLGRDEHFDFNLKKTSAIRCYRPSRGRQRTFKPETPTMAVDKNIRIQTECVPSEFSSSDSFSTEESSKENGAHLFPTPSASPDSIQSLSEPFEHVIHLPFPQSKSEICQDEEKVIRRPINIQTQFSDKGILLLNEVKPTDNGKGFPPNYNLSGEVVMKGRTVSAPKKNPSKRATAPKTASGIKIGTMKGASFKSDLGFSELKQFGGAKCSASTVTRGGRQAGRGKKKIVKGITKLRSTEAHDDIEQAIANIKQSDGNSLSNWNTVLADILQ